MDYIIYFSVVEVAEKKFFSCKVYGESCDVRPPNNEYVRASVFEQLDSIKNAFRYKNGCENLIYWSKSLEPRVITGLLSKH